MLLEAGRWYHALTSPSRGFAIRRPAVLLLCLPLLALSGCGGNAGATTPSPTPIKRSNHRPSVTPTIPVSLSAPTFSGAPSPTPAATATPSPTPSPSPTLRPTSGPAPSGLAWSLESASLRPLSAPPGAVLSAAVVTTGVVKRVEMYLGSGAPGGAGPETFALTEGPAGTWTGGGIAPSVGGDYHYTVGIFTATGRHIVDNDAWNVQVMGAPTAAPSAASLPADISLVPPFSYGNPVPAMFSGDGRSVTGAEVVSNARPDVQASAVASFYEAHLPRAGWSVDQSSIPPAGVASFSIAATKAGDNGTRVCIVQYSGSTVHIFYGTAG